MADADLSQLHDLALPPMIGVWPMAPALLGLLALLTTGLLLLAFIHWRRYRANAYRRRAKTSLAALARASQHAPQHLQELPALLKHTALQAWPREEVAALEGIAWLSFLRRQAPGVELPDGLADLGYWPALRVAALTPSERERLLHAAHLWIDQHVRP
ncbi:DUF4381 domain-containing protein [Pseudomonas sp. GLN_6]|uniref:DUF4381 domain-containing protein n=1 Tax=Pseudomonas sp. GLN_6 TaxID=3367183 RepID=UPI00370C97E1